MTFVTDTNTWNTTEEMFIAVNNNTYLPLWNYTYCSGATQLLGNGTCVPYYEQDGDTQLTEDEVEAYIFDDDNTAELGMGGYNITGIKGLEMNADPTNHMIYDNASCIIIRGDTSELRIC
jgi:hypothetical protein